MKATIDTDFFKELHVMVDVETTGLIPYRHSVIQIGARAFIIGERVTPHHAYFKQNLEIESTVVWANDTYGWWHNNPDRQAILENIKKDYVPRKTGLMEFCKFVETLKNAAAPDPLHFWCKHLNFDWAMLDAEFYKNEFINPFSYRNAWDMPTYIKAIAPYFNFKTLNHDPTKEHDALADADLQVNQMAAAIDYIKAEGN